MGTGPAQPSATDIEVPASTAWPVILAFGLTVVLILRGVDNRVLLLATNGGTLSTGEIGLPIAKAYSGLSDEEIAVVDEFVRKNTLEKVGPIRLVPTSMGATSWFEPYSAAAARCLPR